MDKIQIRQVDINYWVYYILQIQGQFPIIKSSFRIDSTLQRTEDDVFGPHPPFDWHLNNNLRPLKDNEADQETLIDFSQEQLELFYNQINDFGLAVGVPYNELIHGEYGWLELKEGLGFFEKRSATVALKKICDDTNNLGWLVGRYAKPDDPYFLPPEEPFDPDEEEEEEL